MSTTDAATPPRLAWNIQQQGGGVTHITLAGEVDENTDFTQLGSQLTGDTVFDLRGVRRINSCGVREWVNFFRDLSSRVRSMTFVACSPAIVVQLGMIYNFRAGARIASFMAPYVCEKCDLEEEKLLSVKDHFPQGIHPLAVPDFPCKRCGQPMLFDDLPERYLSFLDDVGN